MACLNVIPSAPDQLDQLGGISEFFSSAFGYVAKAGEIISQNQGAVVNILDAAGRLKAQTAAAKVAINTASSNARNMPPVGMTPEQWQAYQMGGAYQPTGFQPTPSWLVPVALGVGALVLVMMLSRRPDASR